MLGELALAPLLRRLEAEQERWFFWVPVLLGVGIGSYFALSFEPHLLTVLGLWAVALAMRAAAPRRLAVVLALNAVLVIVTGFALAKVRVMCVDAPVLAKELRAVDVRGRIELVEPRPERGQRITLAVASIGALPEREQPARVRITTSKAKDGLEVGQAVRMRATLMPPSGPALPGGYDFARQVWFQRIGAVGYAWAAPEPDPSLMVAKGPAMSARIERLRHAIGQRVAAVLPGQTGAIATAMITGERGGISEATNDAFRDSGILHILSISGLHMAIMAGAVFLLVRTMLAAIPAVALVYPIKKWAAAAAMLGAIGYLLISGAAFATVRSAIMISIMLLAVMLDRPAFALRNVVLAAILILALFPESLFDAGFQMSFAAVVGLISIYERFRHGGGGPFAPQGSAARLVFFFFVGIVLSTLIASAAVAPFAAYHFHKSQQYAVIANLIAIPLCNLVVMPAALATLIAMPLGLDAMPLWVMGWGVDAMLWTAGRVASLPGAVLHVPAIPTPAFLMMVAGGLWLTLWQTRWRWLGLAQIAAGLALAPTLELPDMLIGEEGALVAVRDGTGRLSAVGSARSFELERWLENDGDARTPREVVKAAAFRCDGIGCRSEVKGLTLAVARHPAAFSDDCRRADVLVSNIVGPTICPAPRALVDMFKARAGGVHAIYVEEGGALRIETVAAARGMRPWSARAPPPRETGSAPPQAQQPQTDQ